MNKRDLRLDKYGISKNRQRELIYLCKQYPEWKKTLSNFSMLKGHEFTDMPKTTRNTNPTEELTFKRIKLQSKCELIEKTAKEVSADLYPYLIMSVCEEISFTQLEEKKIPCSKASFYDLRRYFFVLLDKNRD